jgi:hypothetical protein
VSPGADVASQHNMQIAMVRWRRTRFLSLYLVQDPFCKLAGSLCYFNIFLDLYINCKPTAGINAAARFFMDLSMFKKWDYIERLHILPSLCENNPKSAFT